MEVTFNTPVQAQPQTAPQTTQPASNVEAGATPTISTVADNVVTAAVSTSDPETRSDDASRRQNGSTQEGVASLAELRVQGLSTRIGFDPENEQVFLEILQPRTNDVIQRIPSEGLVEFLSEQFNRIVADGADGGNPRFDASI